MLCALWSCTQDRSVTLSSKSSEACREGRSSCASATGAFSIPVSNTSVIPIYIGDPRTTGSWSYYNEPLISVTLCSPNHQSTNECETISNVLLDSGSTGLRVFSSAVGSNVNLSQERTQTGDRNYSLAECSEFGTGTDWGPIKRGDIIIGNQTASNTPLQIIDHEFGPMPKGCAALCPDTDPCTSGFNGILGVGLFALDCGSNCSDSTDPTLNPGIYYACDSTGCYNSFPGHCEPMGSCLLEVSTQNQVTNPISAFDEGFNNGLSITMPMVPESGSSQVTSGSLTLGINTSASVSVYPADQNGLIDKKAEDLITNLGGTTYGQATESSLAFIDSGSNGIYFPSDLPICSNNRGFYCGADPIEFTANILGFLGNPESAVRFQIANAEALFASGNTAFSNLCGPSNGNFDWGLPFFFGRTVYMGIEGKTAVINNVTSTGPYWAF